MRDLPAISSPRVLPIAKAPNMMTTPISSRSPLHTRLPAISSPRVFPFARVSRTRRAVTSPFYTRIPKTNGTRAPPIPSSTHGGKPRHHGISTHTTKTQYTQSSCKDHMHGEAPLATDISPVTTVVMEEAWDPDIKAHCRILASGGDD